MRDTYFLQPTPIGEHHNFMDYNGRILGVSEDINPGFPESISIQDYMDRESDTYKEIE